MPVDEDTPEMSDFVLASIDEEEVAALDSTLARRQMGLPRRARTAKLLRECAARRSTGEFAATDAAGGEDPPLGAEWVEIKDMLFRSLAAPYSDHPEYWDEWGRDIGRRPPK